MHSYIKYGSTDRSREQEARFGVQREESQLGELELERSVSIKKRTERRRHSLWDSLTKARAQVIQEVVGQLMHSTSSDSAGHPARLPPPGMRLHTRFACRPYRGRLRARKLVEPNFPGCTQSPASLENS